MREKNSAFPSTMYHNAIERTDTKDICDLFALHFSNVFEKDDDDDFDLGCTDSLNVQAYNLKIPEEEILKKLKRLEVHHTAGTDNIPPIFFAKCASSLCKPLSIIYNTSLQLGCFPNEWKQARIVPIFKSGKMDLVSNYRPISILCTISKVFETLVYPLIFDYAKNYMSNCQHGFLKKKSTTTNLVCFISDVIDSVDNNIQVDAVYTDFSKAFDKVNHAILVKKLNCIGLSGPLLSWCQSYLKNRKSIVAINSFYSDPFVSTSGVPQGSVLGPLLFNIFINDLPNVFKFSKVYMYADDLKITKSIKNLSDTLLLQEDLNRLAEWCKINKMLLNASKCFHIKFTRKLNRIASSYLISDALLKEVSEIRDLGVVLDSKLQFGPHIENIVNSAYRSLGFMLRQAKEFKKKSTILLLYSVYVRSKLEYCCQVWSPSYHVHSNRIELIQRRFVRHLAYRFHTPKDVKSYFDKLIHFKMKPLYARRSILDLKFLYKVFHNNIDSPDILSRLNFYVPRKPPRVPAPLFRVPKHKTNLGRHAPLARIPKLYNTYASKLMDLDLLTNSSRTFCKHLSSIEVPNLA